MITEGSLLWQYLSTQQRELSRDGEFLVNDSKIHTDEPPTDFSYLVFPFAKMYEGFLKQLFLDLAIITRSEYLSDRFRIGRSLSPNLAKRLGRRSAYGEMTRRYGKDLATRLWHTWKEARNLVFHYFPHNLRSLTRDQAVELITLIIGSMDEAVRVTRVRPNRTETEYFGGHPDSRRGSARILTAHLA